MKAAVTDSQRKKENKLKFGTNGGAIGGLVLLGGVVAAGALATLFTNHQKRKLGKPMDRTTTITQLDDRKHEQPNCKEDVQGLRSLLAPSQEHHHHCEESSKITSKLTDYEESEETFSSEEKDVYEPVIVSDNYETVGFPDNYKAEISVVSADGAGNLISGLADRENIEFSEEPIEGKIDDNEAVEDFVAETHAERDETVGRIVTEENGPEKSEEEEEVDKCESDSSTGKTLSNNGTEEEDSSMESNNEVVWPCDSIDGYCCSELTSRTKDIKTHVLIQVGRNEEEEEESIQMSYGDEETGVENKIDGEKSGNGDVGNEENDGFCCSELRHQVEEAKSYVLIQEEGLEEKEEESIQMGCGDDESVDEKVVDREFVEEKSRENSDVGGEEIDESKLMSQVQETNAQILIQEEGPEEQSIQMGYGDEETGDGKMEEKKSEIGDMGHEEIDEHCSSELTSLGEEAKSHIIIQEKGLELEEIEEQLIQMDRGDTETEKEKLFQIEFTGEKKSEISDEETDGYSCSELTSQVEEEKPQILIVDGLEQKEEQAVQIGYGNEETGNKKMVQEVFIEEKKENSNVVEEVEIDHQGEKVGVVEEELPGEETGRCFKIQSGDEKEKQGEIQCEAFKEEDEERNGRIAAAKMGKMEWEKKRFMTMDFSSLDKRVLVISVLVGLLALILSHHIFSCYLHASSAI